MMEKGNIKSKCLKCVLIDKKIICKAGPQIMSNSMAFQYNDEIL